MTKINLKLNHRLMLLPLLLMSVVGQAATLNVATEAELQQAVINAVDNDVVIVNSGTYVLTRTLMLSQSITIQGAGTALVALDGGNNTRVFNFNNGLATLTLKNLQIQNGLSNDGNGGAGLLVLAGTVKVQSVTFKSNVAMTGDGGAIANHGVLNITRSTFSDNQVANGSASGSAIANLSNANLTLSFSTLVSNTSNNNALVSGALHNTGTAATISSSVWDNSINCSGNVVVSQGYNWQQNKSCLGLAQFTDLFNQGASGLSASLITATNTQVYQPSASSTLLDHSTATCTGLDAIGTVVPQNNRCDIGAVEYIPVVVPSNVSGYQDGEGEDGEGEEGIGAFAQLTPLFLLIMVGLKLMRKARK